MASPRPASVIQRGRIAAAGFFFSFAITDEDEIRRRILSIWQPNSRVHRLQKGLVLILARPVGVSAAEAIGLPLLRRNHFLAGLPLQEKELASITCPSEALVFAEGGRLLMEELRDNSREPVHQWIAVDRLDFVLGHSLGCGPAGPVVAKPPELPSVRETLKKLPGASPESEIFLARLKGDREPRGQGRFAWLGGVSLRGIGGAVTGLLRGIASLWPRSAGLARDVWAPPRPSKFSLRLNAALGKLVMMTRLARVLGWRQGRYLGRVMRMFEDGDINEALRHAIPLSSISDSPILKMSFGLPVARLNLQLNPFAARPGSAMVLSQSLFSHLHQLYRATFKRLQAQGRIEEAAFVLAELLRASEEAVAFLELHGRFREAAEIAEARDLAPEIIIRQWFLAGEKERAIQVARRTGAFHGAVLRLEKSRHAAAPELRKLWAQSLAESGSPGAAVDVLWPLESERSAAVDWMKQAAAIGGRAGARSLARLASLAEGGQSEVGSQIFELLQGSSVEDAPARMEFAETLRKESKSARTQSLARLATRAILRDIGEGFETLESISLRQLVDYSGDGALRADLPARPAVRKDALRYSSKLQKYVIPRTERGSTQISEAALLPNGTCAVAMGEAGLKLVTKDGRTIAHFGEPADRLVVSENGAKIITLARRGGIWALAKMDLASRKAVPWCHAEISRFARSFDGAAWYVVCGHDLYAIDATSKGLDATWRVPEFGRFAGPLALSPGKLDFITYQDKNFWLWEYQLPWLSLRKKELLPFSRLLETVSEVRLASCAGTGVLDCSTVIDAPSADRSGSETLSTRQILFRPHNGSWSEFLTLDADQQILGDPAISADWLALAVGSKAATSILVFSCAKGGRPVLRLEVEIEGRCNPAVRFDGELLTIADELGHLRAYGLAYGEQIRALNL